LAINTGYSTSKEVADIFGSGAKPINLPKLNSFLAKLKPPSFTPWIDVLTTQEIAEYQRCNHRKFPLLHLIPKGISLSDLKSNKLKRDFVPGLENDCWRFLVDVSILTAGSPYGRYMTVDVFRSYTEAIVSIFIRQSPIMEEVLGITGGGSAALIITYLIFLLLLYKCRRTSETDAGNHYFDQDGSSWTTRTRKERLGDLLTVLFLTIFYIPISKFAVDTLTWHNSLSMKGDGCYSTEISGGFNWVQSA
jgi:hypothetical protein